MSAYDSHPLVLAALAQYPAQSDRWTMAATAAEQAENLLAVARQVAPTTPAAEAEAALRAADRSVRIAQREYASLDSLRWMEASVRELESLARSRFGPKQVVVALGYEPIPGSGPRPTPRGPILGEPI